MNVQFQCPFCRAALEVSPSLVGKVMRCPLCQGRIAAPGPTATRPALPMPDALHLTTKQLLWGVLGFLFLCGFLFLTGLLIGYFT